MLIDRDMKKVHAEWLDVLDLRVPTTNNSKLIYREIDLYSILGVKK